LVIYLHFLSSSFRGSRSENPESILPMVVMDSGLVASRRPGMTTTREIHQNRRAPLLICSSEKKISLACVTTSSAFQFFLPAASSLPFHHPHLAHAARSGDAEHLAGLVADNSLTMYSTAGAMPSGPSAAFGFSL